MDEVNKRIKRKREFPVCGDTGSWYGKFFPPTDEEVYSITKWYADAPEESILYSGGKEVAKITNEEECLAGLELRIFLSSSDWCKFQEQSFYQEIFQYLDNLKIRKEKELLG